MGLILCSAKDEAIVKYALAGNANKVLAAEYRTALPNEQLLADHVEQTREALTRRAPGSRSATRRRGAGRPAKPLAWRRDRRG